MAPVGVVDHLPHNPDTGAAAPDPSLSSPWTNAPFRRDPWPHSLSVSPPPLTSRSDHRYSLLAAPWRLLSPFTSRAFQCAKGLLVWLAGLASAIIFLQRGCSLITRGLGASTQCTSSYYIICIKRWKLPTSSYRTIIARCVAHPKVRCDHKYRMILDFLYAY